MDIQKTAKLARLGLTDSEVSALESDFKSILSYVEKLNQLELEGVEPAHHPFGLKNVFRADESRTFDDIKAILDQAPKTEENCFSVPEVIKRDTES